MPSAAASSSLAARHSRAGRPTPLRDDLVQVDTLSNGVRLVVVPLPQVDSASVSVFIRSGSRHEGARDNGISHVVEHMAFKGTATRSCQQINLDAERLGAEVNAHTDKDHTAFHMRGLAAHAGRFVHMLADIVLEGTFPEAELERERQVILQEVAEDEDDAFSTAFKLYDRQAWGTHALARPVIGQRRNIERFDREDLQRWVRRQYNAGTTVVAVAGRVDPAAMLREAEQAFGAMAPGTAPADQPAAWQGGFSARRQAGVSQSHVVLGFPLPSALQRGHAAGIVAATLFGEGMSSPLMDEVRERQGLVYYAACSADLNDLGGQFVIEASMGPQHVEAFAATVQRLLQAQAERIAPQHLERARHQLAVRALESQERPYRRMEEAVLDLFTFGRVRSPAERLDALQSVGAQRLRAVFEGLLQSRAAAAVAGRVARDGDVTLRTLAGG